MNLISLSGKRLNPEAPVGFYVAMACSVCGSPIYYHGGGIDSEGTQHSHMYFPTCVCEGNDTMQASVPPEYDWEQEREGIMSLFINLHEMLSVLNNPEPVYREDEDQWDYLP